MEQNLIQKLAQQPFYVSREIQWNLTEYKVTTLHAALLGPDWGTYPTEPIADLHAKMLNQLAGLLATHIQPPVEPDSNTQTNP